MIPIPVLLELAIHKGVPYRDQILNLPLGDVPMAIDLNSLTIEDAYGFIQELRVVLAERNINMFFPNPFYICHKTLPCSDFYFVIQDQKMYAKHFLKKLEYPRGKELAILNKVNMITQKIKTMPIDEFRRKVAELSDKQQKLLALCDKADFLDKIGQMHEN